MGEQLLSELIEQTQAAVRSFEYSRSTVYQYQMAWRELTVYFNENQQVIFSKSLTQRYVLELKAKLDAGTIKLWRYTFFRLVVRQLIEVSEQGHLTWNCQKKTLITQLHQSTYLLLLKAYLNHLQKEGKSAYTIEYYESISRQFLNYLEQRNIQAITEIQLDDIRLFIPFISKQYHPTSMRTVLTVLRSFLGFVESKELTSISLSRAIPSSFGRKTAIILTITGEEEQKLLSAVDRTTPLGKRNYAMLLLALRTGMRSVDIIHLKLTDIHWRSNTLEIVQEKTGTALVLPLLTDVGNAIVDYLLNGRPDSQQPTLFLRTRAPHQNLSGGSVCYEISCQIMKAAGIRQGKTERKGFHCLRHTLAARLLAAETPLPVISSILGHRNKESTKIYLSTDLAHLRACALSLNGIEIKMEAFR
jgi:site-specific recombinase XerD